MGKRMGDCATGGTLICGLGMYSSSRFPGAAEIAPLSGAEGAVEGGRALGDVKGGVAGAGVGVVARLAGPIRVRTLIADGVEVALGRRSQGWSKKRCAVTDSAPQINCKRVLINRPVPATRCGEPRWRRRHR